MSASVNKTGELDLAPYVLTLDGPEGFLDWAEAFGNDRPVVLEVGSGKGLFLANHGRARPELNLLGIELSIKFAKTAAQRVAKQGLPNVKVLQGNARDVLGRRVAPGSLAAVHVYFPDPWWKAKHKKRRVFVPEFAADVERALAPGGKLHLASDVQEYYEVMTAIMAERPRFVPLAPPAPTAPEHELDYLTNFERKYRIEGRAIYRAAYRLDAST